jgi:glycolate oxidase FAD binding subunit
MNSNLAPATLRELAEAVRSSPRLLAVGARTKPGLSELDWPRLATTGLKGIIEYNPSEFTFTALAGTPVKEIAAALGERGQYLPFDPMLVDAGATLGGTVAAGLNGPGRFRFGGIRDFILGVRFVDGRGQLLRMGGKVVKNAAGFDLPKFFVGSMGRFGVMGELTFKVFPRRATSLTFKLVATDLDTATRILTEAGHTRWELEALDILPAGGVCARLAGPEPALEALAAEILACFPGEILSPEQANALWAELREFGWAHPNGPLLKLPLTPTELPGLHKALRAMPESRWHVSGGGNVAYISVPEGTDLSAFEQTLTSMKLVAISVRGNGALWRGTRRDTKIASAIKGTLDPEHRFPAI